ncbi:hypothetical protein ABK040_011544 [Willaertia magna]
MSIHTQSYSIEFIEEILSLNQVITSNVTNNNITNSTSTSMQSISTVMISLYAAGAIAFSMLALFITSLLLRKWSELVRPKKIFYGLIIVKCIYQVYSHVIGIISMVLSLYKISPASGITNLFNSTGIIFGGYLCIYCFTIITRMLYVVYFNRKQWWMRTRSNKKGSNEKNVNWNRRMAVVVKMTSIIVFTLFATSSFFHMVFMFSTYSLRSFGTFENKKTYDFYSQIAEIPFIIIFAGSLCYFSILNLILGVALSNKLTKNTSDFSPQRKRACRNLNLLTAAQCAFGLVLTFSVLMWILFVCISAARQNSADIKTSQIFTMVFSGVLIFVICLERFSIFLFVLAMAFIYGPLDQLSTSDVKKGVDKLKDWIEIFNVCRLIETSDSTSNTEEDETIAEMSEMTKTSTTATNVVTL